MRAGLTEMQIKSLRLIENRNNDGMGARMPYAEMIEAADELVTLGLVDWRNQPTGSVGRWITSAGRLALSRHKEASKMGQDLDELMAKARERVERMTPAEREAMYQAQRESFVRAMAPCEHGMSDWEDCTQCRMNRP